MESKTCNFVYKIIVCGASSVGKTSLISKYADGVFLENPSTIGAAFRVKKIGILYSKQYTLQWFKETKLQGEELGVNIIGKTLSDKNQAVNS